MQKIETFGNFSCIKCDIKPTEIASKSKESTNKSVSCLTSRVRNSWKSCKEIIPSFGRKVGSFVVPPNKSRPSLLEFQLARRLNKMGLIFELYCRNTREKKAQSHWIVRAHRVGDRRAGTASQHAAQGAATIPLSWAFLLTCNTVLWQRQWCNFRPVHRIRYLYLWPSSFQLFVAVRIVITSGFL